MASRKHRAVADSLEEAGDRLFNFTRLPPSQWRSPRTTNAIERLHEEFKRRIKTQTVLPSADTAAMLFWALQSLWRVGQQVPVLVERAALRRHAAPDGGERLLQARRAVDEKKLRPAQAARHEAVEDGAPGLRRLAAHALDREQHLLAVLAHTEHNEERDCGGLPVEPNPDDGTSRISRTIGSAASERAFQASQSLFTFRHTRLTVSLPTAPPNRAASARRTRRVLVPAR